MKETKFSWDGYWKPTPLRLRKLGDALLGIFSIASVSSVITDHKELGIASLIIGIIGKTLSNFFSEEPVTESPEDQQD
jgi:hypothetical protein